MGLATTVILKSLDIHMATLFGLLAFVLNFIPNVGAVVATLLPLPILLVSKEVSLMKVILAVFLPTAVHLVIGSAVEPKILGDSLELHPITVMLCLIFWGLVWGIPGMLLAAPLTAALKIIFEGIEVLQVRRDATFEHTHYRTLRTDACMRVFDVELTIYNDAVATSLLCVRMYMYMRVALCKIA